ncbi:MAG TPA: histone deacetylase [Acidobacteriota bacterium]|nr:histone deacetylase [Acidobacteriota bacterium]
MSTAFLFNEIFLQHNAGLPHPENPQRLLAILHGLKQHGFMEQLIHVDPSAATEDHILLCHSREHFEFIRKISVRGSYQIDPDTHVSSASFDAAMVAAGAAIRAVDGIMANEFSNAFAAVRPPGHHATRDQAMGFCLFNNIAIAARWLTSHYHLKRVLIMDWDVHHGNGTQDIFWEDPSIIYISLHKKYHYPGTGWEHETGGGSAKGTKINFPIDRPSQYMEFFTKSLAAAEKFEPEFILISCGFDAHEDDPLGNLHLKNETYAEMTRLMFEFAEKFKHQRVFSILEGGYDYDALSNAGSAHTKVLLEHS